MRDSYIETDPGNIDPAWLNQYLNNRGEDSVQVASVDVTSIGTGQLARTVRLSLEFAHANNVFPRSLVGKFPSENETSLETATLGGLYRNEVGFYRDLQSLVTIRTPKCYYAEVDSTGAAFTLLLEDLKDTSPGDQITGCDPKTAQAAVLELAGLHAPTWKKPELRELNWMEPADKPAQTDTNLHLFQTNLPGFIERFTETLDKETIEIFERVAAQRSYSELFSQYDQACLIHGDYRLDNLLIDVKTTPASVYTVDWQTVTFGNPMLDVALFLGGGLQPEARRHHEENIVREYHERLGSLGVADYDWHQCWNDYRRATFTGFMTAVNAAMMTVRTARGDELFNTMVSRHIRHAVEVDATALLP